MMNQATLSYFQKNVKKLENKLKRGVDWLSICVRVLSRLARSSCLQITSTDLDLYQYQTFLSNTLFPLHIIISHLTHGSQNIASICPYKISDK